MPTEISYIKTTKKLFLTPQKDKSYLLHTPPSFSRTIRSSAHKIITISTSVCSSEAGTLSFQKYSRSYCIKWASTFCRIDHYRPVTLMWSSDCLKIRISAMQRCKAERWTLQKHRRLLWCHESSLIIFL